MKRVITAIGNEELNKILQNQEGIIVVNSDIQYQEGIIEALDKYHDIDIIILNENIMGNLEIEELIMSIIIIKNDIEIILITDDVGCFDDNKNVVKTINHNNNYVKETINYILKEDYIKTKNETLREESIMKKEEDTRDKVVYESVVIEKNKKIEKIKEIKEKVKHVLTKSKKEKDIIMVVGSSGVRQNYFYFYTIKTN